MSFMLNIEMGRRNIVIEIKRAVYVEWGLHLDRDSVFYGGFCFARP